MSEDFRTTVSRGGVAQRVPRVHTVEEVKIIDEEWISYRVDGWADLPDEFYLRVLQHYDGDCALEEIAEVVRAYGQLCLDDFAEWSGDSSMGNWEQRSIAFEKREEYKRKYGEDMIVPETLLHLWEGRPHLDWIRFLRDGWIVASATGDLADYQRVFEGLPHGISVDELVRDWVNGLNKGLSVAHARIDHPLAYEDGATLFGASCLQLYNHIVEQAQYKICANESCGQFFVRQQGRSGSSQRKSEGVKYCSSKCARAQAQRELRRRRVQAAPTELILDAQVQESRIMTAISLSDRRQEWDVPTIGAALREKRLERSLDDRAVRRRAGVAAPVLVAIEADDFDRYEGQSVHMERWLTSLARLYELDDKDIIARYRADLVRSQD